MKALILAAGFGTRLRPVTNKIPKTLVPVNNIPIILYILSLLKHHKIKDVVINLHHLGDQIPKFLSNGKKLGLNITYSHEAKILGTGGGIKKAMRYLSDDFLIINGDVIADFDLSRMIKQHKKNKPLATLALYQHKESKKYGLLHYQDKNLFSIVGHPEPPKKTSAAMFAGFHILSKHQTKTEFKKFKPQTFFCIMRDIYIPQIKDHKKFGAFVINGFWNVCDSMNDVQKVESLLNKKGFRLSYHKELRWMTQKLDRRWLC